ncbi:hypothetical protein ACOMHN_033611 [Nucella lapillus]
MSAYPLLACADSVISPIEESGNYFIMDSEQLVCNPFQDHQTEAMNEVQKKASMTEKLTSVKNNVCENHFTLQRRQLERKKEAILKQIHDHSSKLRYEVKLMDLDRQKHKIEVRKRILPERDYSYDEMQISNSERRLGANIASFYLERRLRYPPRLKAGSDIAVTPTVRQARQALRQQDVSKSADYYAGSERAGTAKSGSSAGGMAPSASPVRPTPPQRRRGSRSAPLVPRCLSARVAAEGTRLPAIGDGQEAHSRPAQVKFMFEDPMKILISDDPLKMPKTKEETQRSPLQNRPFMNHPGMQHRERFLSRDYASQDLSDDDDDDLSLPDHVDLRALFFDKEGQEEVVSSKSVAQSSHVPTPILRRSQTFAPKITQDLIQQEHNQVQSKVDRFLQDLNDNTHHYDNDDSDSELGGSHAFLKHQTTSSSGGGGVHATPTHPDQAHTSAVTTYDDQLEENGLKPAVDGGTPREPKDAWKYIKGRDLEGGSLRGTYRAEDLVLQTLTGVPLARSLTAGVPLHSASRAMRHTATFKMRKVVEGLISERTKYQQHEVEEIKRRMDQGMDVAAAAASLLTAPTPAPGPTPPSRKASRADTLGSGGASRKPSSVEPIMTISQGVHA